MSSNQEKQTVTPYLILKNSNQFIEFTQKVFGASITSVMPPADQEYGRSCGAKDAFGNTWWITSDLKK